MFSELVTTLHPIQKEQIQSMDPAFPVDDADYYAVYDEDGSILSAIALIEEDSCTYECYGYTKPSHRGQGLFSELLDIAIDELPEDVQFLFYTNGKEPDTMAAIRAFEAELILEEHMMELPLEPYLTNDINEENNESAPVSVNEADMDGTRTLDYENEYGIVHISVFSSYYYLYGFEIREELRGQGYGKQFLNHVLYDLAKRAPLPLRLQVSGDNLPALSLYKKTGFQITETLSGYLY